ncbi:MAG: C_GCAxxG_C_C family protein [Spirochaetaceae bacterium]|nr:MAG: C_GCAxxG_C_C family protein [Spirochaetaceae bacterium]
MADNGKIASEKFISGYNCAQSVLFAFADKTGVDENTLLKIATGLGAGMGRKQEVCGAVTGGILALSMLYGRGESEGSNATESTYIKTREFMEKFSEKHGSVLCSKLLDGCVLGSPEGQARFKACDMKNKICVPCVRDAAEIVAKIIG